MTDAPKYTRGERVKVAYPGKFKYGYISGSLGERWVVEFSKEWRAGVGGGSEYLVACIPERYISKNTAP